MIRYKNQIRLHLADIDWIKKLTGNVPPSTRTVQECNALIDRHLAMENSRTPESQLIALLLQDETLDFGMRSFAQPSVSSFRIANNSF